MIVGKRSSQLVIAEKKTNSREEFFSKLDKSKPLADDATIRTIVEFYKQENDDNTPTLPQLKAYIQENTPPSSFSAGIPVAINETAFNRAIGIDSTTEIEFRTLDSSAIDIQSSQLESWVVCIYTEFFKAGNSALSLNAEGITFQNIVNICSSAIDNDRIKQEQLLKLSYIISCCFQIATKDKQDKKVELVDLSVSKDMLPTTKDPSISNDQLNTINKFLQFMQEKCTDQEQLQYVVNYFASINHLLSAENKEHNALFTNLFKFVTAKFSDIVDKQKLSHIVALFGKERINSKQTEAITNAITDTDIVEALNQLGLSVHNKYTKSMRKIVETIVVQKSIKFETIMEGLTNDWARLKFIKFATKSKHFKDNIEFRELLQTLANTTQDSILREYIKKYNVQIPAKVLVEMTKPEFKCPYTLQMIQKVQSYLLLPMVQYKNKINLVKEILKQIHQSKPNNISPVLKIETEEEMVMVYAIYYALTGYRDINLPKSKQMSKFLMAFVDKKKIASIEVTKNARLSDTTDILGVNYENPLTGNRFTHAQLEHLFTPEATKLKHQQEYKQSEEDKALVAVFGIEKFFERQDTKYVMNDLLGFKLNEEPVIKALEAYINAYSESNVDPEKNIDHGLICCVLFLQTIQNPNFTFENPTTIFNVYTKLLQNAKLVDALKVGAGSDDQEIKSLIKIDPKSIKLTFLANQLKSILGDKWFKQEAKLGDFIEIQPNQYTVLDAKVQELMTSLQNKFTTVIAIIEYITTKTEIAPIPANTNFNLELLFCVCFLKAIQKENLRSYFDESQKAQLVRIHSKICANETLANALKNGNAVKISNAKDAVKVDPRTIKLNFSVAATYLETTIPDQQIYQVGAGGKFTGLNLDKISQLQTALESNADFKQALDALEYITTLKQISDVKSGEEINKYVVLCLYFLKVLQNKDFKPHDSIRTLQVYAKILSSEPLTTALREGWAVSQSNRDSVKAFIKFDPIKINLYFACSTTIQFNNFNEFKQWYDPIVTIGENGGFKPGNPVDSYMSLLLINFITKHQLYFNCYFKPVWTMFEGFFKTGSNSSFAKEASKIDSDRSSNKELLFDAIAACLNRYYLNRTLDSYTDDSRDKQLRQFAFDALVEIAKLKGAVDYIKQIIGRLDSSAIDPFILYISNYTWFTSLNPFASIKNDLCDYAMGLNKSGTEKNLSNIKPPYNQAMIIKAYQHMASLETYEARIGYMQSIIKDIIATNAGFDEGFKYKLSQGILSINNYSDLYLLKGLYYIIRCEQNNPFPIDNNIQRFILFLLPDSVSTIKLIEETGLAFLVKTGIAVLVGSTIKSIEHSYSGYKIYPEQLTACLKQLNQPLSQNKKQSSQEPAQSPGSDGYDINLITKILTIFQNRNEKTDEDKKDALLKELIKLDLSNTQGVFDVCYQQAVNATEPWKQNALVEFLTQSDKFGEILNQDKEKLTFLIKIKLQQAVATITHVPEDYAIKQEDIKTIFTALAANATSYHQVVFDVCNGFIRENDKNVNPESDQAKIAFYQSKVVLAYMESDALEAVNNNNNAQNKVEVKVSENKSPLSQTSQYSAIPPGLHKLRTHDIVSPPRLRSGGGTIPPQNFNLDSALKALAVGTDQGWGFDKLQKILTAFMSERLDWNAKKQAVYKYIENLSTTGENSRKTRALSSPYELMMLQMFYRLIQQAEIENKTESESRVTKDGLLTKDYLQYFLSSKPQQGENQSAGKLNEKVSDFLSNYEEIQTQCFLSTHYQNLLSLESLFKEKKVEIFSDLRETGSGSALAQMELNPNNLSLIIIQFHRLDEAGKKEVIAECLQELDQLQKDKNGVLTITDPNQAFMLRCFHRSLLCHSSEPLGKSKKPFLGGLTNKGAKNTSVVEYINQILTSTSLKITIAETGDKLNKAIKDEIKRILDEDQLQNLARLVKRSTEELKSALGYGAIPVIGQHGITYGVISRELQQNPEQASLPTITPPFNDTTYDSTAHFGLKPSQTSDSPQYINPRPSVYTTIPRELHAANVQTVGEPQSIEVKQPTVTHEQEFDDMLEQIFATQPEMKSSATEERKDKELTSQTEYIDTINELADEMQTNQNLYERIGNLVAGLFMNDIEKDAKFDNFSNLIDKINVVTKTHSPVLYYAVNQILEFITQNYPEKAEDLFNVFIKINKNIEKLLVTSEHEEVEIDRDPIYKSAMHGLYQTFLYKCSLNQKLCDKNLPKVLGSLKRVKQNESGNYLIEISEVFIESIRSISGSLIDSAIKDQAIIRFALVILKDKGFEKLHIEVAGYAYANIYDESTALEFFDNNIQGFYQEQPKDNLGILSPKIKRILNRIKQKSEIELPQTSVSDIFLEVRTKEKAQMIENIYNKITNLCSKQLENLTSNNLGRDLQKLFDLLVIARTHNSIVYSQMLQQIYNKLVQLGCKIENLINTDDTNRLMLLKMLENVLNNNTFSRINAIMQGLTLDYSRCRDEVKNQLAQIVVNLFNKSQDTNVKTSMLKEFIIDKKWSHPKLLALCAGEDVALAELLNLQNTNNNDFIQFIGYVNGLTNDVLKLQLVRKLAQCKDFIAANLVQQANLLINNQVLALVTLQYTADLDKEVGTIFGGEAPQPSKLLSRAFEFLAYNKSSLPQQFADIITKIVGSIKADANGINILQQIMPSLIKLLKSGQASVLDIKFSIMESIGKLIDKDYKLAMLIIREIGNDLQLLNAYKNGDKLAYENSDKVAYKNGDKVAYNKAVLLVLNSSESNLDQATKNTLALSIIPKELEFAQPILQNLILSNNQSKLSFVGYKFVPEESVRNASLVASGLVHKPSDLPDTTPALNQAQLKQIIKYVVDNFPNITYLDISTFEKFDMTIFYKLENLTVIKIHDSIVDEFKQDHAKYFLWLETINRQPFTNKFRDVHTYLLIMTNSEAQNMKNILGYFDWNKQENGEYLFTNIEKKAINLFYQRLHSSDEDITDQKLLEFMRDVVISDNLTNITKLIFTDGKSIDVQHKTS